MNKSVAILVASLLTAIVGCASLEPVTSMRGVEVNAADAAPAAKDYAGKRPGTQPVVARTFSTQPPVIPHAVANFDDISLTENQCLDCHGQDNYVKKNAPKLGDSHFVAATKEFDPARHVCVNCHVPQVDAPALVDNRFTGNIK
jgi:cytochrome c-type protein NapB